MDMPQEKIDEWKRKIDAMTQSECARIYRHGPSGHPIFKPELFNYFMKHFNSVGGMTPQISKRIGWGFQ